MPRKIAIVQGHPDPAGNRLCHALAAAYADGARHALHDVTLIEIAALDFPLLRSRAEFETGEIPAGLLAARDAVVAADHLVIIFPLWLGTMPALLKGFLEQVMRPGVAFAYLANGSTRMLMQGRSARVVVTMGMPALAYRVWFLAHGVRGLTRNILRFVGYGPVRETFFGMAANVSPAKSAKWLRRMRDLGAKGA